ncbi:MAG: tRNA (N(6)-L-threonylcarbamoyladenosine(37)-C(2))-methylthiotransferase MtaB [Syntrophaceae bacterium]|nr:tRNA (N(6)-L-threonylcarbamoyladenosine(37)-C(2))-methylthiotransferase MtaB [Syntrophaceae bacterium]
MTAFIMIDLQRKRGGNVAGVEKKTKTAADAKAGAPTRALPRVAVTTLGCKVNQCDSAGLAATLVKEGMTLVPFGAEADWIIINTCTVTAKTDNQSRQLIRRAVRQHPKAQILVTGCYAQRAPEEIARISGVRLIAGNKEKAMIPVLLASLADEAVPQVKVGEIGSERRFVPLEATVFPEHTRSFLKIQDGCDAFCTYCIVPYARGHCRSLPPAEVSAAVRCLADKGYREVVLTGVHLGAYGRDLKPPEDLTSLLAGLLAENLVDRLRLSSIEPREITEGLLAMMWEGKGLCRHLHIPLQSGDDGILKSMRRNYDAAFFHTLIKKIHQTVPGIAIGIDCLVGFPGETEAAFDNTYELIEALPVAYLHVFPYSRRPGTPAASLPGQIPEEEKNRRSLRLRRLGTRKRRVFARQFLGHPMPVLIEDRIDGATGSLLGLSDHYIPVAVLGSVKANQLVSVLPQTYREGRLIAEVLHAEVLP